MAIVASTTSASGVSLPGAYVRVLSITAASSTQAAVSVGVYRDSAARADGLPPVETGVHYITHNPDLPLWAQAYASVKERFPGAVDC